MNSNAQLYEQEAYVGQNYELYGVWTLRKIIEYVYLKKLFT